MSLSLAEIEEIYEELEGRYRRPHAEENVGARAHHVHTQGRTPALELTTPTRGGEHRRSSSPRAHAGKNDGNRAHHMHLQRRTQANELSKYNACERRRQKIQTISTK